MPDRVDLAEQEIARGVRAATLCAAAMIACQVASKAVRDAYFLSTFSIAAWPPMVAVSAALSLVVVLYSMRLLPLWSPRRVVPIAFTMSALLQLAEWGLASAAPRAVAILLFLHVSVLGAALVSWFWSLVNESFDPRTTRKRIAGITTGAVFGGMVGGVVAERIGSLLPVLWVLPVLAALQLLCAWSSRSVSTGRAHSAARSEEEEPASITGAFQALAKLPYLRHLAGFTVSAAAAAALLDYLLKSEATRSLGGAGSLLRFFSFYYAALGALGFVVQVLGNQRLLERAGLPSTIAFLPGSVVAGAASALFVPHLLGAAIARGAEAIVRNSLFRSGYELLFTPLAPSEKRGTKTLLDVGGERIGDALGAGIVVVVVAAAAGSARVALLVLAALFGVLGLFLAVRLGRGYVGALESRLLTKSVPVEEVDAVDRTTAFSLASIREELARSQPAATRSVTDAGVFVRPVGAIPGSGPESQPTTASATNLPVARDPLLELISNLRARDAITVRRALHTVNQVEPAVAPHLVALLGRDELASEVITRLRGRAQSMTGALADALLDPSAASAIRRRVPRVLAGIQTERSVQTLVHGLADARFEVRYACGQALARLHREAPALPMPVDAVEAAVLREVSQGRSVWEGQRLLERIETTEGSPYIDAYLRDRSSRNLEHVFALLSLTLPAEPIWVAFRALHSEDRFHRGTALEYLESVLPGNVRDRLWNFIEDDRPRVRAQATREQVLESLMRSNESIRLNLSELRGETEGEPEK